MKILKIVTKYIDSSRTLKNKDNKNKLSIKDFKKFAKQKIV